MKTVGNIRLSVQGLRCLLLPRLETSPQMELNIQDTFSRFYPDTLRKISMGFQELDL
jgi:hypothetical protein